MRKKSKRNPDFYTDKQGHKHPIRGSKGYLYVDQDRPGHAKIEHSKGTGRKRTKKKQRQLIHTGIGKWILR